MESRATSHREKNNETRSRYRWPLLLTVAGITSDSRLENRQFIHDQPQLTASVSVPRSIRLLQQPRPVAPQDQAF